MSLSELLKNEPIVIVEDDVDLAEVFKDMLEEFKVPIRVYNSPFNAIKSMRQETPCIIFSDIHMPGMDGLELSRQIREILPLVPIVLISGNATKEIAIRALKVGINELLDKPVSQDTILGIANKFISARASYLEREKQELEVIVDSFVDESFDLLNGIDELIMKLENKEMDTVVVDNLFRRIHSIKGSVGAVPDSAQLSRLSHEFESSFDYIRKGKFIPNEGTVNLFLTSVDALKKLLNCVKNREVPTEAISTDVSVVVDKLKHLNHLAETNQEVVSDETYSAAKTSGALSIGVSGESEEPGILVQNEKLDALLKLSGEMTMVRNYFQILSRDAELQAKPEILYKKSDEMLRGFNKITDSLQKQIMELRQVNLETVFSKLPRTVRTTAQELGKKVQIKFSGGEIGIDKNIAKDLNSALIHMIRNSIDHGIENSQKRASLGKTLEGNIQVDAIATPGVIKIVISDDGAGLDRVKIEKKAISNRLVTEENARKMSDQEIFQFIFHAGFSTMEHVSSISGRGVGMDVVKNAMINHHGRIQVESVFGLSTTFTMFLPIVKSVLVESTVMAKDNGLIMGVPQAEISYITVAKDLIRSVVGASRTVQFDNRTIPMFSFNELMSGRILLSEVEINKKSVIIMQHKDQQLALLVDAIDGQFDAVILPFDKLVKALPGFKGTTLLGSDGVAYIVSVQQMVSLLNSNKVNLEVAV